MKIKTDKLRNDYWTVAMNACAKKSNLKRSTCSIMNALPGDKISITKLTIICTIFTTLVIYFFKRDIKKV